jgi:membrane protease YdiL (CAAX protease family)
MAAIRRHPLAALLTATYVLSILIFAIPLLGSTGLGVLPIEVPGKEPFLLLLTFALVGTAFGVTAIADGRDGVRSLRRRAFRFLVSPVWYVLALVLLPLSAFAVAVALEGTAPLAALAAEPALALGWLAEIAVAVVLINFWEEVVWSGFVLHRLQPRFGPMGATAATTWAQAAMHLPLLFVVGGLSDNPIAPPQYPFYLVALFVLPLANRTVATWLYNRSGNSVPAVGLMHSSWNFAAGSAFLPALVPGFDAVWAFAGFAVVAVILVAATRGRLGYQATLHPEPDPRRSTLASAKASAR